MMRDRLRFAYAIVTALLSALAISCCSSATSSQDRDTFYERPRDFRSRYAECTRVEPQLHRLFSWMAECEDILLTQGNGFTQFYAQNDTASFVDDELAILCDSSLTRRSRWANECLTHVTVTGLAGSFLESPPTEHCDSLIVRVFAGYCAK